MGRLKNQYLGSLQKKNIATGISETTNHHNNKDLLQADVAAFSCLLRRCGDTRALTKGKQVHVSIVGSELEQDRFLGNLLVQMYGKCGALKDARAVFSRIQVRNVFSWAIIIGTYVQNGECQEALRIFQAMLPEGLMPDRVIFVSILSACASEEILAVGKWVHAFIDRCGFQSDVVLGTALVHMYGKCGSLGDARRTFDQMRRRDAISWTAMIALYSQHGHCKEALRLFERMHFEGMVPNRVTFISILDACASQAALVEGKYIHEHIASSGLESDVIVGNALVSMYGKCGSLEDAHKTFKEMHNCDVVSWTALISAYAQQGMFKDALQLFQRMLLKGVTPDRVAFLTILSACSHAGLANQGFYYFESMNGDHGIIPDVEHYNCMVDLLGRLGRLHDVEDFIKKMPVTPTATSWMTMLGACNMHLDIKRGRQAAEHVFKLDPENATPYILLSNMYESVGRWDDAAQLRQKMKDKGLKKQQGCSLIEVGNTMHEFIAGDSSHPLSGEIYAELQSLNSQIKEAGYEPDTKVVLHDVEEEEKEHMLWVHSEKLAVAFGIISTPHGTPLCIIKNLKICRDCHSAIKYISKLQHRDIIVRDTIQFHLFKNGVCSCADYW